MKGSIWLFPLLFLIHDMEELLYLGPWIAKHDERLGKRFPPLIPFFNGYKTKAMGKAVIEELALCILLTLAASSSFLSLQLLWYGAFIAFTLHLVIHILQAVIVWSYIPAVATGLCCMPFCIWILQDLAPILSISPANSILYTLLGFLLVVVNLAFIVKRSFLRH